MRPTSSILEELTLSNYALTSLLTEGGMGKIYKGIQLFTGQKVVIKILNEKFRFRSDLLQQEMKLNAHLNHPCIAKLLDAGIAKNGTLYLVHEHLEGESLTSYMMGNGLESDEFKYLILELMEVLVYCHSKGVIHGDIKPSNIIVVEYGLRKHLKLIDFGSGVFKGQLRQKKELSQFLTPGYCSPEQLKGRPLTEQTDWYAWGMILLQYLNRKLPFKGDSKAAIFQSQLYNSGEWIPGELQETSLGKLLSKIFSLKGAFTMNDAEEIYRDFKEIQLPQRHELEYNEEWCPNTEEITIEIRN